MRGMGALGGPSRWQARLVAALSGRSGHALPIGATAAMLMVGLILHYGEALPLLAAVAERSPVGVATRQAAERILFLLPVTYASYVYGARGGAITLGMATAIMLPCAIDASSSTDHALPEMGGVLAVGSLLVVAITQQKREVEAEKKTRDSLQYFVRQILSAQEDERRRIALELHDETAQSLLLTCQRLDHLVSLGGSGLAYGARQELEELRSSTLQTLSNLRLLTQNLRPRVLDDHGLVPAFEWLADLLEEQYGIRVSVETAAPLPEQPPETQLLLFRIVQEALRNVGRHSGATEATVKAEARGASVRVTVRDNGCGFRPARSSDELANSGKMGIVGMYERARLAGGALEVRSAPGEGTCVVVELPIGGGPAAFDRTSGDSARSHRLGSLARLDA